MLTRAATIGLALLFFLVGLTPAFGQDDAKPAPERTLGILFSTSNILMDIGTYGTGVGLGWYRPENAIRAFGSGVASNSSSTLTTEAGVARVGYLDQARVSPYWIVSGSAGFLTQKSETGPDNWTRTTTLNATAGMGLGAEVFILDFLSVFADYQLLADVSRAQTRESVGGAVTQGEATWTYVIQTALGNTSRLGLAIYLDPVIDLEPLR